MYNNQNNSIMKKQNYLWSVLTFIMVAMLSFGFMSCGGKDNDDPEPAPTPTPTSVSLSVSPSDINLTSNAGAQGSFIVACTNDWTVSCSESWITISPSNGSGSGTISVTASTENPNRSERTATITVKSMNESKYVTVKQAAPDVLILSGLDAPFDAQQGSIQTAQELSITCNGSWTLEGKPEWLDISALTGSGNSTIKVWPNEANNSTSERKAILTVKSGTKSESKTVTQRAGYDSNLQVSPNTVVTLADGFAFDYTFGPNVKYYYVARYLPSAIDRKTDAEIIREMSSDDSNRDTPSDGYVTSWKNQNPSTEYIICTVGFDQNGNYGALSKMSIKTKSGTNQAAAIISNVQYNDTQWIWSTTVNAYLTRYYMWFNTNSYWYDTTDAAIAWFFKRQMEKYPNDFQPIAQSGQWSRNRNDGNVFDVITWALDVDGNFSGVIDRFQGQITSESRKLAPKVMSEDESEKRYKTFIK